ncbi:Trypanosomal VSG domain containing protein [Trypanosoma brucei equiperdum]|uniref:Trypanosomal VSG domain containing protein n=1 Tax=Trypanosoma brucei equiperdum TaxID=630700 RepID=A0A3L6L1X4_9TRYP|nr:Trypanosomal VSG domain containing protein [Trypanosoma brucei equiperdum]
MKNTGSTIIVALLLLLSSRNFVDHASAAGKDYVNQADLAAICRVVAISKSSKPVNSASTLTEEDVHEIDEINLTIAESNWKSRFATNEDQKKEPQKACTTADGKEDCLKHWSRWEQTSIRLAQTLASKKILQIQPEKLDSAAGRAARLTVAALAAEAHAIKADFDATIRPRINDGKDDPYLMLKKAVFGDTATADETANCKVTMTSNRASDCKLPAAVQALCFAAVCICAQDGTQSKELYGTAASSAESVGTWTSGAVQQKCKHVLTACNKLPAQLFSATSLLAAAAGLRTRFKQYNGGANSEVYMGTIATASHNCAQSNGHGCIPITDAIPHGSEATKTLNWLDTLEAAAAKQVTIEAVTTEAAAAKKRIHMLTKQAKAALVALKWAEPAPEYTTPSENKTTSTNKGDDSLKQSEKECNTKGKDKEEECDKLKAQGCVYKEDGKDGKKCTLSKEGKKEAAEKAKKETGNDGNTDCSSHHDQKSSEAVNKQGQTTTCG